MTRARRAKGPEEGDGRSLAHDRELGDVGEHVMLEIHRVERRHLLGGDLVSLHVLHLEGEKSNGKIEKEWTSNDHGQWLEG